MNATEARQRIVACKTIIEARHLYPDIYKSAGKSKEMQTLAWLVQQEVNDFDEHKETPEHNAFQTMNNIHALPECVKNEQEAAANMAEGIDPRY